MEEDPLLKRRVKVYQLDENGAWSDKGTGHVACTHSDKHGGMSLIVICEDDGTTLLESKIVPDDIYQIQQDTLIVWTEPETNIDLALSFQLPTGCEELWNQLCNVQIKLSAEAADDPESLAGSLTEDEESSKLPPANMGNLPKIAELVTIEGNSPIKKEKLVVNIIKEGYIGKLLDLFEACEDLENKDCLNIIFVIFKTLIMLNDTNLFEVLFSDENFIKVMGALEYDPELSHHKVKHREFLTKQATFKQVVPMKDQALVQKIHQTFRMQYLKDVAMARLLDDGTFSTLNSMIFFNNIDVVNTLASDQAFLKDLFDELRKKDNSPERKRDLATFIQDFCTLGKTLQLQSRSAFYRKLVGQGLFDVLEPFLAEINNPQLRMTTAEILNGIVMQEASLVRQHILKQAPQYTLLHLIVRPLSPGTPLAMLNHFSEILRLLLLPDPAAEEKDRFLNVFYQEFVGKLVQPLTQKENLEINPQDDADTLESKYGALNELMEIMSFCVQHHSFRIKTFVLGNNLAAKILKFTKHKEKHLQLAAIKFFRTFVCMKDDFYYRHVIKQNLFEPVVDLLVKIGNKYNLVNSAIIELFEFIKRENIKSLITYLAEKFGEQLQKITYVDTFQTIMLRYQQSKYSETPPTGNTKNGTKKRKHGNGGDSDSDGGEDGDEAYFNDDDDDPAKRKLVDYEDDEENNAEAKEQQTTVTEAAQPPPPPPSEFKPLKKKTDDDVPTPSPITARKPKTINVSLHSSAPSSDEGDENGEEPSEAVKTSSSKRSKVIST